MKVCVWQCVCDSVCEKVFVCVCVCVRVRVCVCVREREREKEHRACGGERASKAAASASRFGRATSARTKPSVSSLLICTTVAPDSGEAQYKFRLSNKGICSYSEA